MATLRDALKRWQEKNRTAFSIILFLALTPLVFRTVALTRAHSALNRSDEPSYLEYRGGFKRGSIMIIHFIPSQGPDSQQLVTELIDRGAFPSGTETVYWMGQSDSREENLKLRGFACSKLAPEASHILPGEVGDTPKVAVIYGSGRMIYFGEHKDGPPWLSRSLEAKRRPQT